jgi:hypothetical protein
MSKLPVSSAARAFGMSRSTLRGLTSRGSVPLYPGNRVDTVDLERAGYRLQPDALAIEEARQSGSSSAQKHHTAGTPQTEILLKDTDLFRQIRDEFRRELDAAHERQVRLLRLLDQMSRYVTKTAQPGGASALGGLPPPQNRTPIMTLLRNFPQGLTREEIETKLDSPKNLRNTLQGMYRAGLVVRPKPGVYMLGPEHRGPAA